MADTIPAIAPQPDKNIETDITKTRKIEMYKYLRINYLPFIF
jgi:hypothetical protein